MQVYFKHYSRDSLQWLLDSIYSMSVICRVFVLVPARHAPEQKPIYTDGELRFRHNFIYYTIRYGHHNIVYYCSYGCCSSIIGRARVSYSLARDQHLVFSAPPPCSFLDLPPRRRVRVREQRRLRVARDACLARATDAAPASTAAAAASGPLSSAVAHTTAVYMYII